LHKCFVDILMCVNAAAAKLISWRCGNKLIKALSHLTDKSKNTQLSKWQNIQVKHCMKKARKAWKC